MSCSEDGHSGLVGGVDGVRGGGWVMAATGACRGSPVEGFSVWDSFTELWRHARDERFLAVTVDIPIGLPCGGDRAADREARRLLKGKPGRQSSVFPAPPRCTLEADTYQDARKKAQSCRGKGLTAQTYALFPKIREVRGALQPGDLESGARPLAAEVHPEVSFGEMVRRPMGFGKSLQPGVAERLKLLSWHFPNIVEAAVLTRIPGPPTPALDDVLDAAAAAWTARRLTSGRAKLLGGCVEEETGCTGDASQQRFPMGIWA